VTPGRRGPTMRRMTDPAAPNLAPPVSRRAIAARSVAVAQSRYLVSTAI